MSARNVLGINLSLPPAPSDHLQHPPDHLLHVVTLDVHLDNFILPNVRRRLRLIPGTFLADTQNLSSIERFINKLQTYCPLMLLSPALNPPSSLTFLHAHCGILCNQDKDCLNFLFEENSCILGGLQVPLLENDDEDISYFSVEPIG